MRDRWLRECRYKGSFIATRTKRSHRTPSGTESADAQDNIKDKRTLPLALGFVEASILSRSGLRCVVPLIVHAAPLSYCFPVRLRGRAILALGLPLSIAILCAPSMCDKFPSARKSSPLGAMAF